MLGYVITMLEDIPLEESEVKDCLTRTRTVGWFSSLTKAENAVEENKGDMRELRYNYTVIEQIEEGVYCRVLDEFWYEWDEGNDEFDPMDNKPHLLRSLTGFGIG